MTNAQRAIERFSSAREVDLSGRALDYRGRRAIVDGFTDADSRINSGIYLLALRGEIVRVCKVRKNFHETVAGLRSRPAVLSAEFDQVLIRVCHPDEIDRIYSTLIETYGVP